MLAGGLAQLTTAPEHPTSSATASGRVSWYGLKIELPADSTARGRINDLDLAWTTSLFHPEPSVGERTLLCALHAAEASILPVLPMLVAPVLFTGVQSRSDRSHPNQALAPAVHDDVGFIDPAELVDGPAVTGQRHSLREGP